MDENEVVLMRSSLSPSETVRTALKLEMVKLDTPLDGRVMDFLVGALDHAEKFGVPWTEITSGKYAPIVRSLEPINDPSASAWAMSQLRSTKLENDFSEVLLKTMTMLKSEGASIFDAVGYLTNHLPKRNDLVFKEVDLAQQYRDRKGKGRSGLESGINVVDVTTDGQLMGELWMSCGYTGTGKSFHLINVAYHRRMAGLNGIYFSTEMPEHQIKRRFCVRHSRHEKFGLVSGISDTQIKRASLTPDLEELWLDKVLPDWDNCANGGKIEIVPVGSGAKLSEIFSVVESIHANKFPVHYVMLDYLSQMRPSDRTSDGRFVQTALIIETKAFALNFDNRRGMLVWTAAQTNPSSMIQAHKDGFYGIRSVAETAEAERSSDFLMYLLRRDGDKSKGEVAAGILKNRDGSSDQRFVLSEDFDKSYLGDKTLLEDKDADWNLKL